MNGFNHMHRIFTMPMAAPSLFNDSRPAAVALDLAHSERPILLKIFLRVARQRYVDRVTNWTSKGS